MNKRIYILLMLVLVYFTNSAQEHKQHYTHETLEEGYGPYQIFKFRDSIIVKDIIRDTVYLANINDVTSHFKMSFDEFVNHFLKYTEQQDSTIDRNHLNYFKGMINNHLQGYRCVLKEYSIGFSHNKSMPHITKQDRPVPATLSDTLELDFMFVLEGEKHVADFLESPKLQHRVLYQIFSDINDFDMQRKHRTGLNFYFPDFSFKEKRAMAQFVKSVSLLVDSIKVKKLRNIPLYFTFNEGNVDMDFLQTLSGMVDDVFLAKKETKSTLVSFESIRPDKKEISFFKQVQHQLYLARFHIGAFPEVSDKELLKEDVEKLMQADYGDAAWEYYLFSITLLFLLILIGGVCYMFFPTFTNFVNDNSMYVFAGGILLVLEIYLLFVIMIETMSQIEVFSFQNSNLMLFLPLMIMFVIPLIKKAIGGNRIVP